MTFRCDGKTWSILNSFNFLYLCIVDSNVYFSTLSNDKVTYYKTFSGKVIMRHVRDAVAYLSSLQCTRLLCCWPQWWPRSGARVCCQSSPALTSPLLPLLATGSVTPLSSLAMATMSTPSVSSIVTAWPWGWCIVTSWEDGNPLIQSCSLAALPQQLQQVHLPQH